VKAGLLQVRSFVIPSSILHETIAFLQEVGLKGYEGFVLWTGELLDTDRFRFCRAIVPEQRAMVTESGLLVTVEGKALFEVNKAAHAHGEILAAQVHSHPTDAYHSSTDDAFPLVTLLGALSIVVPNFGMNALREMDLWAWYRLSKRGRWVPAEKTTKVEIE
jgi:proteasome lid subunit RPN8/RPN11